MADTMAATPASLKLFTRPSMPPRSAYLGPVTIAGTPAVVGDITLSVAPADDLDYLVTGSAWLTIPEVAADGVAFDVAINTRKFPLLPREPAGYDRAGSIKATAAGYDDLTIPIAWVQPSEE